MARLLRKRIRYLEDEVATLEKKMVKYVIFLRYIMYKKKTLKLPEKLKTWALMQLLIIEVDCAEKELKEKLDDALFGDTINQKDIDGKREEERKAA